MTSETERRNNANRLAMELAWISEDESKVKAIAQLLNYEPSQLKTDMQDIFTYLNDLERQIILNRE